MDKDKLIAAIEAASNVTREGAQALHRLELVTKSQDFAQAVEILHESQGIIYLIGIGKSGIVGQKIAATLTSVGSPSTCVHATDALHGDLGAIRFEDPVVLISKSGETREILGILPHLQKQGNKIIAITNNADSALSSGADITLPMLVTNEGCPLNLAPMTSSTTTMAIGDALAAALIIANEFTTSDFAAFHPAGRLGKMLTGTVANMINEESNPTIGQQAPLREAVVALVESRLGGISIVDGDGKLVGMLTDGDLKRFMINDDNSPLDHQTGEVMTKNPTVISLQASAAEAIEIMENRDMQLSVLPVVDNSGRPVGMLRLHDVIRSHL
jgi:arabinose-5-phosphate isomerase